MGGRSRPNQVSPPTERSPPSTSMLEAGDGLRLGRLMPDYEFRFRDSAGQIGLTRAMACPDADAAKENAKILLATILDFDVIEVWSLDRHVHTLRRNAG